MVAAGTGIGGAVVLGGQLWRGVGGLAGEIGHTSGARGAGACDCGGTDCLHLLAGGRAIAERRAGSGAPAPPPGDTDRWHLDAAEALGIAAADAVSVLAVPLVVVGGGLAELRGFVDAVSDAFHRHLMAELSAACSVEPARAGYRAGALGAVSLARGVLTRTAPRAAPSG
jgi:glucokinase